MATQRSMTALRGFTLLELVVVIAVLGILAAIAVPSVSSVVKKGRPKALEGDGNILQLAIDNFKSDEHAGPSSSNLWGVEAPDRFYPTEDGLVGDLELNPDETDPDNPDNPRIDLHLLGPGTDGPAADDDINASLIWMGLLVNEPFGTSPGEENLVTGNAHPLSGEVGQYLTDFIKSAAEDNADRDLSHINGNGYTQGSYRWVLLKDTRAVPAYKSGTRWYAGPDGSTYP